MTYALRVRLNRRRRSAAFLACRRRLPSSDLPCAAYLMAGRRKARRAPNGVGSIYQREFDGRWVGAAYVLTGAGVVKRKVVYGASWEEAHANCFGHS